jgi:DUF2075 family protein
MQADTNNSNDPSTHDYFAKKPKKILFVEDDETVKMPWVPP